MKVNYTGLEALAEKDHKALTELYLKAAQNENILNLVMDITPHGFSDDEADGIARAIFQAFGKAKKMDIRSHQAFLQEQGIQEIHAKKISAGMGLLATMVNERQAAQQQAHQGSSGPNIVRILIGAVLMIVGIALTANSNSIFYGAIAVGFFMIIGGFVGGSD